MDEKLTDGWIICKPKLTFGLMFWNKKVPVHIYHGHMEKKKFKQISISWSESSAKISAK